MATSITSTGIVFPDSTVQTTAAGAGGSSLEAVASGSLSNGDMVIVNSDGTVSVVGGAEEGLGTATIYANYEIATYNASAYDSANQKVVLVYVKSSNQYGYAIVGTVSGSSISFGTEVVFNSQATVQPCITYDSANEKIVIICRRADTYIYSTVGTVSGTSISFGSFDAITSVLSSYPAVTYDSTNGALVVAYKDNSLNKSYAKVGYISGTSISWGSASMYNDGQSNFNSIAYSSADNKVVIVYQDSTASSYGVGVAGTVSGSSISFGTEYTFEAGLTEYPSIAYNSADQNFVIAYNNGTTDDGIALTATLTGTFISYGTKYTFQSGAVNYASVRYNSSANAITIAYKDVPAIKGKLVAGTISGDVITFGSPQIYNDAETNAVATVYDPVNANIVISYRNDGNTNKGTAIIFTNASTNLTAENFIGVSDGAYSDGQTATVQLLGSVDDAQTSLTPGQKYYVQTDGSLSVTPGSPEVLAGTAVATTKLVIKR